MSAILTKLNEHDLRFTSIEKDIVILKDDVGTLKADVGTLKADVGTLKADVGTLKADVGTLKTDVGTLKTDVGTLKTDVGTLKTDVETLKTDVGTLKTDVSCLSTRVDDNFKYLGSLMEDMSQKLQLVYEIVQVNMENTYSREVLDNKFERHEIRLAAVEAAYRDLRG